MFANCLFCELFVSVCVRGLDSLRLSLSLYGISKRDSFDVVMCGILLSGRPGYFIIQELEP